MRNCTPQLISGSPSSAFYYYMSDDQIACDSSQRFQAVQVFQPVVTADFQQSTSHPGQA
jgi:hypothetical protein